MCLILIKPAKVKMTDAFMHIASKAFRGNPDGSSIGIKRGRNNGVVSVRGLMTEKSMIDALERLQITTEDTAVLHLRQGTQGDNSEENTHGFVIGGNTDRFENLMNGSFYEHSLLYHNGCFHGKITEPEKILIKKLKTIPNLINTKYQTATLNKYKNTSIGGTFNSLLNKVTIDKVFGNVNL
jgi:predicted glutamine amidotransferase